METARYKIRRDYAPLNVAASISYVTQFSPPTQIYDNLTNQYEPNRQVTPCVIAPIVTAAAIDGSWASQYANSKLVEMQWLVNGKDITTQDDWKNLYSINQEETAERGSITIKRNVEPGKNFIFQFKGVLADHRTGRRYNIKTEEIVLTTREKGDDGYSVSVGGGASIIQYNPLKDPLLLYDYNVSQGHIEKNTAERDKAAEAPFSYELRLPIVVFCGKKKIAGGYQVDLYKVKENGRLEKMALSSHPELIVLSTTTIKMDMRLIKSDSYVVQIRSKGVFVAQAQFSIKRMYPKFRCRLTNSADMEYSDKERYDVVQADSEGEILQHPEAVLRIVWKTDTANHEGMVHNEGESTIVQLDKAGVGTTYEDDWLEVYVEAEQKDAYAVAADAAGTAYGDAAGNLFIFN